MALKTESKTFYPQAYDTSDYSFTQIVDATNPVGKGSSNNTNAAINTKTGKNAESYVFWPFDLSVIPKSAEIQSVSCNAGVAISNGAVGTHYIQMFSGSTAKGTAATNSSTSKTIANISCGTWTRAELENCRLRQYLKRGTSSTSTVCRLSFYGADLTVTYTYQSEKFMLKLGGAWTDVARVFKKVSGIWVEQTDLANVIEDGVRYQNGGEIESTRPNLISFTAALSFGSEVATYQAEEGMTWAQWVASSHNTDGFYVKDSDNYVYTPSNFYVYDSNGKTNVKKTDTVIAGYAYGAL